MCGVFIFLFELHQGQGRLYERNPRIPVNIHKHLALHILSAKSIPTILVFCFRLNFWPQLQAAANELAKAASPRKPHPIIFFDFGADPQGGSLAIWLATYISLLSYLYPPTPRIGDWPAISNGMMAMTCSVLKSLCLKSKHTMKRVNA